jgi:predicted porin
MQKKLLTVAVAGVLAAPVVAMAEVTVYGTIDTGIRTASKVCKDTACTQTGSLLSMTDGERTTNRWGLKGSEDLGGGLRANFTLEGQYSSDTGGGPGGSKPGDITTPGGSTQGLFQRKSIVGLSGGAWSVDLGRDYTANFKTQGVYDPMSYTYTGITPTAGTNVAQTRSSNMITAGWRFGTGGIRAEYAMGEQVGDTSNGARFGGNFDFALGGFTIVGAYSSSKLTLPAGATLPAILVTAGFTTPLDVKQSVYNIGGVYKLGAMTFRAGYSDTETKLNDASLSGKINTPLYALGLQYDFTPAVSGRIGYYNQESKADGDKVGSRDWFLVAVDYNLSKTTTLYAAVDVSNIKDDNISVNGQTGAITLTSNSIAPTLGSNVQNGSTGISAGIMHAF